MEAKDAILARRTAHQRLDPLRGAAVMVIGDLCDLIGDLFFDRIFCPDALAIAICHAHMRTARQSQHPSLNSSLFAHFRQ